MIERNKGVLTANQRDKNAFLHIWKYSDLKYKNGKGR